MGSLDPESLLGNPGALRTQCENSLLWNNDFSKGTWGDPVKQHPTKSLEQARLPSSLPPSLLLSFSFFLSFSLSLSFFPSFLPSYLLLFLPPSLLPLGLIRSEIAHCSCLHTNRLFSSSVVSAESYRRGNVLGLTRCLLELFPSECCKCVFLLTCSPLTLSFLQPSSTRSSTCLSC